MALIKVVKRNKTYSGWQQLSPEVKSTTQWERDHYRRIISGSNPVAHVKVDFICDPKVPADEQRIGLYKVDQTREIERTAWEIAKRQYYDMFIRPSSVDRHLEWHKAYLDCFGDQQKQGWHTESGVVRWGETVAHLNGSSRIGVHGGVETSFLLLDLDLHTSNFQTFLARLNVLLRVFHGKHGNHFHVAEQDARGVHLLLPLPRKIKLGPVTKWMRRILQKLDESNPECQFIAKNRKADRPLEVYPNPGHGVRLPLCVGRTALLNGPLRPVERRKRLRQDVAGYMAWLNDPNRQYMPRNDVFRYIIDRLDLTAHAASRTTETQTQKEKSQPAKGTRKQPASTLPLKGNCRDAIIRYWRDGDPAFFSNINKAIIVSMRMMHTECVSQDEAVDLMEEYIDDLPDKSLSSRLEGDRAALSDVVRRDSEEIWAGNDSQPAAGQANDKLATVIKAWKRTGFLVSDKSTWNQKTRNTVKSPLEVTPVTLSESASRKVTEGLVPILVGSKQAAKPEKQQEVVRAVEHFLGVVEVWKGGIDQRALPTILKNFDLKLRSRQKQCRFFKFLQEHKLIHANSHPFTGKATEYSLGEGNIPLVEAERLVDDMISAFDFDSV